MDKRSIATRNKIKRTYLDMIANKQPVNVRALVRKANINKSTFYRYYSYIEELENETLKDLAKDIYTYSASMKDNKTFVENFFDYFEQLEEGKKIIFARNPFKTTEVVTEYAFDEYRKHYNAELPKLLTLYIVSSGCINLLVNRKFTREDRKAAIIKMGNLYRETVMKDANETQILLPHPHE